MYSLYTVVRAAHITSQSNNNSKKIRQLWQGRRSKCLVDVLRPNMYGLFKVLLTQRLLVQKVYGLPTMWKMHFRNALKTHKFNQFSTGPHKERANSEHIISHRTFRIIFRMRMYLCTNAMQRDDVCAVWCVLCDWEAILSLYNEYIYIVCIVYETSTGLGTSFS